MTGTVLDIPAISQHNATHDDYYFRTSPDGPFELNQQAIAIETDTGSHFPIVADQQVDAPHPERVVAARLNATAECRNNHCGPSCIEDVVAGCTTSAVVFPGLRFCLRTHFLLLAISVTLTLGCASESKQSTSRDRSTPNVHLQSTDEHANDSTSDSSIAKPLPSQHERLDGGCGESPNDSSGTELRRYVWLQDGEYKKVAATPDSIGLVLTTLFSPPGQWSVESIESDWADGLLRYHCYVGIRGYESCGQPESIGNPSKYRGPEDVFIYFKYKLITKECILKVAFHSDHPSVSESRRAFLVYHGFPIRDTVSVSVRKLELR